MSLSVVILHSNLRLLIIFDSYKKSKQKNYQLNAFMRNRSYFRIAIFKEIWKKKIYFFNYFSFYFNNIF